MTREQAAQGLQPLPCSGIIKGKYCPPTGPDLWAETESREWLH